MMNDIRVVLFHNGLDNSVEWAKQLNEHLTVETTLANVYDPRSVREALPIRSVPGVGVLLLINPEDGIQDVESVLRKLELIKSIDEVEQLVTEISASGALSKEAKAMAVNLFRATLPEDTAISTEGGNEIG